MALLQNKTTRAIEAVLSYQFLSKLSVSIDNSTQPFTMKIIGVKDETFVDILSFLAKNGFFDEYIIQPIFTNAKVGATPKKNVRRKKKNHFTPACGLLNPIAKNEQKEKVEWIPKPIVYDYQTRLEHKNRFYNDWKRGS